MIYTKVWVKLANCHKFKAEMALGPDSLAAYLNDSVRRPFIRLFNVDFDGCDPSELLLVNRDHIVHIREMIPEELKT